MREDVVVVHTTEDSSATFMWGPNGTLNRRKRRVDAIATQVEGIDALVTGHQHRVIAQSEWRQ